MQKKKEAREDEKKVSNDNMVAHVHAQEDPPEPAYLATSAESPLHPPTEVYRKLRGLQDDEGKGEGKLLKRQDFVIEPRSGKAWKVEQSQVFRLSTPEGAQVGDLNVWNQHDVRERFWAARTRQLQGSHMREGDRLWSNLPFMRPLCGIVADGCQVRDAATQPDQGEPGQGREERRDERGGVTKWGGRCHDLLGTRCDPYGEFIVFVVCPFCFYFFNLFSYLSSTVLFFV